jgi:hypothetical protein
LTALLAAGDADAGRANALALDATRKRWRSRDEALPAGERQDAPLQPRNVLSRSRFEDSARDCEALLGSTRLSLCARSLMHARCIAAIGRPIVRANRNELRRGA